MRRNKPHSSHVRTAISRSRPRATKARTRRKSPSRGTLSLSDIVELASSTVPPCVCDGKSFVVVGADRALEYFTVECKSCRKTSMFHIKGRKLTMMREID